jgi:hypothetical protein
MSTTTVAKVLLTDDGVGLITPLVPPSYGGSGTGQPVLVNHNAGTTMFTASGSLVLTAPVVVAPGAQFGADGATFSQGVTASGQSIFGSVAANEMTADTINVTNVNAAVPGGGVNMNSNVTVHGDLTVTGKLQAVNATTVSIQDKVITLGSNEGDGVVEGDVTRDRAGIVVAGAPAYLPVGRDAALYEHSLRWERRAGDFTPSGDATHAHLKPLWKVRGGGLSIVAPDHADREAEFFFAPTYTRDAATLGLYYALGDGRTRLVQTFSSTAFPGAGPVWTTRAQLVACVHEDRPRSFLARFASSYTLQGGALPPGTAFSSAGLLTGAPEAVGTYAFTLRALTTESEFTDQAFVYHVAEPAPFYPGLQAPRWTTRQIDIRPVPAGCGFSIQFDARDPYQSDAVRYSVVAGNIPEGSSLSDAGLLGTAGVLSAGSWAFTLRAFSEASHLHADKAYSVTCVDAPAAAATVTAVLTSKSAVAVGVNVINAASVAVMVENYSYVSFHQDGAPATYWAMQSSSASGNVLTVGLYGKEAMSHRAHGQGPEPPATAVAARIGFPVTMRFYPFAGVGQLRIPRDLGDMNTFNPQRSSTIINRIMFRAEVSFSAEEGSPGDCCNGGFVRSGPAPGNWTPRSVFHDYVGPTTTVYHKGSSPEALSMSGEYFEVKMPMALVIDRYSFDPTVSDVPASWALLGATSGGQWELLDDRVDVPQPLDETDYGTSVSDVAADRVYSFENDAAYEGYRMVVRSTTGLVGNTFHLSSFALILTPVA